MRVPGLPVGGGGEPQRFLPGLDLEPARVGAAVGQRTTVRQTPAQEIDAPMAIVAGS